MLDSERSFKIKARSRWKSFQISLMSAVICIKRVLHGKEIVQYLQNYKRYEIDQGYSKKFLYSSTRVSLSHFLHNFEPLLREIFGIVYIAIVFFRIKPFLYTTKKSRRKFKYLVNEKSF